jgi:hypothetical protein
MYHLISNSNIVHFSSTILVTEHCEIHAEQLLNICYGNHSLLKNEAAAKVDGNRPRFMTVESEFYLKKEYFDDSNETLCSNCAISLLCNLLRICYD